jgi:hypothetical protein
VIAVVGTTTFASEHPGLNPEDDDNHNGITNYAEYAQGFDPTAINSPPPGMTVDDDLKLRFSLRSGASDVFASWQSSTSLETGSWAPMIQGADYHIDSIPDGGHQQEFTLELLDAPPADPRRFYRIELDSNPRTRKSG